MIGGFGQQEVTQEHIDLVEANKEKINTAVGVNSAHWNINSVQSQVVAGVNYKFHLTAENLDPFSVKLFVPLPHTGNPTEVASWAAGHVEL